MSVMGQQHGVYDEHRVGHQEVPGWASRQEQSIACFQAGHPSHSGGQAKVSLAGNGVSSVAVWDDENGVLRDGNGNGKPGSPMQSVQRRTVSEAAPHVNRRHRVVRRVAVRRRCQTGDRQAQAWRLLGPSLGVQR
ncbi:hypothetical protein [Micromonospora sp. S4605]|uniref:hypothetical protein n=1 Tax=Micromonospora sp. S4605 TaxID=1420897 RepID=UPI0011B7DC0E|nr:hypothetical protein [Micromonospora sp. S4605]